MLTVQELLVLKSRVLLAAETASRIAGMEGEPLELDEETYELVMTALVSLKDDARRMFAEIDILRGMTMGDFGTLFAIKGEAEHGRSEDVGRVEPQAVVAGGEGERTDNAAAGSPAGSSGPDGEDSSRPRPRRNRRRRRSDQSGVDTASGADAVGGSADAAQ